MIIMGMLSAVLLLVCETSSVTTALALGANDVMVQELTSYIRGFAVGLPFLCLGTQFTAFLQLEHQEKRSYVAVAAMFAVNSLFNWLFVAVFHMGLFGLGLSTSVSNVFFLFFAEGIGPHKNESDFHNIGLHLVSRISRLMTYQNTFGLNILTIYV